MYMYIYIYIHMYMRQPLLGTLDRQFWNLQRLVIIIIIIVVVIVIVIIIIRGSNHEITFNRKGTLAEVPGKT